MRSYRSALALLPLAIVLTAASGVSPTLAPEPAEAAPHVSSAPAELPSWLPIDGKTPPPAAPAPEQPPGQPATQVPAAPTPAAQTAASTTHKAKQPAADRKTTAKPAQQKPAATKKAAAPAQPKKPAQSKKPAAPKKPATDDVVEVSGLAAEIVAETNRVRADNDLPRLKVSRCLTGTSRTWAVAMDADDLWEHSDLRSSLTSCDYSFAAENLALVHPDSSAAHVVQLWMDSPGHRANLLSEKATSVSVSVQYDASRDSLVIVQQFGRP